MKKNFSKMICAALALVLIVALCAALAACDKDKQRIEREERERTQCVQSVEEAILGAMNEDWHRDMSDASVVALDSPGDYVVAKGWTALFADTLKASALQTAKLKNLANAICSDEGKAIMGNLSDNAQLLLPVLREVGFTKDDISALFYDLSSSLFDGSGRTLDAVLNELVRIMSLTGLSSAGSINVTNCIGDVNAAKSSLVPSESKRKQMIEAFEDARAAIEATIAFVYDISLGTLNDDLWGRLFEGSDALKNITDNEITLVINSLLANVTSLKSALTAEQINKLNVAFDLLIDNFDEDRLSSALYAQIIVYAKYANMFVGASNMLLTALESAGDILTEPETLAQLRNNSGDWNAENGSLFNNVAALAAKFVKGFTDEYDSASLKAQFDRLFELCGAGVAATLDVDKTSLLIGIDAVLNLVDISSDLENINIRHPQLLDENDINEMTSAAFALRANLDNFKQAYRAFKRGEADIMRFIAALNACNFRELGVVYLNNVQITSDNIDAAYDFYMSEGMTAVKKQMATLAAKAYADIKLFVDDYYAEDSVYAKAIERLSDMPLTNAGVDEATADKIIADLKESGLLAAILLLLSNMA